MEWFNTLIGKIADFMQTKIDFLSIGEYSPAVYIAVAGAILVLLAFFIALGIKAGSSLNKLRKTVEDGAAYINATGAVDENNIDGVNARIQNMPGSVRKGWGNFLEQQAGYPSDYITLKDIEFNKKTSSKHRPGKVFFGVISWIFIALIGAVAAISCKDMFEGAAAEKITLIALSIAGTIAVPVLFYVVFSAILAGAYKSQYKKFTASFVKFQDALDNNVIIFREEQDEFISENIEEINATIEEILANKLDNTEIIEIVTTPKVDESLVFEEEPVAEPEEATEVQEPAPQPAEEQPAVAEQPVPAEPEVVAAEFATEEERGSHLLKLVYIVNDATMDDNTSPEDLVDLTELIYDAKIGGSYPFADEQEIFDQCLEILATAYYRK